MELKANTLDDLLRKVLEKLLSSKTRVKVSRGNTAEIDGVLLQLNNPLARLSRTEERGTVFSCLGELLWYLSKSKNLDFIGHYLEKYKDESDDGKTIYGGYGPRLFAQREHDQIDNVISLLRDRDSSRRAVVQIFNAEDISKPHKEIPCTCTFQFLIRNKRLNMYTYMRSNDAYFGLPHDIYSFTMLQEIVARSLDVGVGKYMHMAASLHLYVDKFKNAQEFLEEGFQASIAMPPMPPGDPWPSIHELLKMESKIRTGIDIDIESSNLDPYWQDLARLLKIYKLLKDRDLRQVSALRTKMSSRIYETYIRNKMPKKVISDQLNFTDNIKPQ